MGLVKENTVDAERPSDTAMLAAVIRAGHPLVDGTPTLFYDDLALRLSGAQNEAQLVEALNGLTQELSERTDPEFGPAVADQYRIFTLVRSRYAEDELNKAVANGVTQYVVLGAGLDSFAYRRSDLAGRLTVFEVDHPNTQRWKQERLNGIGVETPDNLTFVATDFESRSLSDSLQDNGFDVNEPTFFSWLGVIQYLQPEAVFSTLDTVAGCAPGTQIVFEYTLKESELDEAGQRLLGLSRTLSADRGEPLFSFFTPDEMSRRLADMGFVDIEDFGPEKSNARYLCDRTDGLQLRVPSPIHLMNARVGR
jgi:methyltransferase (TIGR00027 family)